MRTVTLGIRSSLDDVSVQRLGAGYPPTGAFDIETDADRVSINKRNIINKVLSVGFLRFDTSGIPKKSLVLSASLRLYLVVVENADTRLALGEWYDASHWPISGADWTSTTVSDAFSVPLAALTQGVLNDIPLLSPDAHINKGGETGLRLHISGVIPTGNNRIWISSFGSGLPSAELILQYRLTPTFGYPKRKTAPEPFGRTARKHLSSGFGQVITDPQPPHFGQVEVKEDTRFGSDAEIY